MRTGGDFEANHSTSISALGIDTSNFDIQISQLGENTKIYIKFTSAIESGTSQHTVAINDLETLKTRVTNNLFTVTFTDANSNSVVGNAKLDVESDSYHYNLYRYNVLYTFASDSNIKFKFENAISSDSDNVIQSGDKVYILDADGKYLQCKSSINKLYFNPDQIGDTSLTFIFMTYVPVPESGIYDNDEPQRQYTKLLFEIHGYYDSAFTKSISSGSYIQDDYGLHIEVLPPSFQGVFTGLSQWIDGYTFDNDGTYDLDEDRAVTGFNISYFYNLELGTLSNDPSVADTSINIDQMWLTWDGSKYSVHNQELNSNAIKFYNGSRTS